MDALGNIFHVKLFGYSHWFMPIIISQMKYHSISVDQDRYDTYIGAKYLDTATVKTITKFYKTNFPSYMIFNKVDVYTSDDQVEKFTRLFNIQYRA